jgi:hypothetical protein
VSSNVVGADFAKLLLIDPAKMAVLTSLVLPDSRRVAGFQNV